MVIYVNNIPWKIKFVNPTSNLLERPNGTLALAVTDGDRKAIYLNESLKGALLRKVLIHEVTHVWMFSYGFDLSVEDEEFVCDFVASNADDILSKVDELVYMGLLEFRATL